MIHTHTHTHRVEFYSVISKNETMWLEGKWMQLKDIMVSKVIQAQKDIGCMFSLILGDRYDTNIRNIMKNRA
jgi:hypothetical protein